MKLPDTIEELQVSFQQVLISNNELREENQQLKERIKELEQQLNMNSRNSSKPPSSDGHNKRPALTRTKKGDKGGKKGHKGKTLRFSHSVDKEIDLSLPEICDCGCSLSGITTYRNLSRQVFEIPEPKLEVIQYNTLKGNCPCCGKKHSSNFPDDVQASVQYGSRVKALVTMLNQSYKLPVNKVQSLFEDLFGQSINEGTIITATQTCFNRLKQTENNIREKLLMSNVVHFDETGLHFDGKSIWLHCASTSELTYLFVHRKRGTEAFNSEDSLLKDFTNWAVHDCWGSYFTYPNIKHALCGAHLLRELYALIEGGSFWARQMHRLLLLLYERKKSGLSLFIRTRVDNIYDYICQIAEKEEPPPKKNKKGRSKSTKGRNLLKRLKVHKKATLAFYFNEQVPFTNNQAERDVRPAKLKQKISGCFRTFHGAQIYARIESFVASLRKSNLNIFKELSNVFECKNYCLVFDGAK